MEAGVAHYRTDEPSVGGDLPASHSTPGPPEARAGRGRACRELLSRDLWGPHTREPHSWRRGCRQLAGLSPAKGLPSDTSHPNVYQENEG